MAKRKTCFLVAACVWMALLACGALNCAYADEPSDGANSWRFLNGELVLSDSGASTDNLGTFEEAAADSADSADGVMACSIETNPNGHYPVFNWFDQFSKGYCTGVGAYKGIDVSEWQGKINWAQVKTAGVDFAILRCGYASTYADTQWHNNVQGCLSTGMPFGAYLYSRATSSEEASKEADFVISQLKSEGLTGADLAFPVYFDMEDKKMVGKNYAAIAQAFFEKLTAAGYPVGTYANLSWWNTYLTSPVFDKYSKWVAAYNTSIGLTYAPMSNFSEGNGVWQFSDYGIIPGLSERATSITPIWSPSTATIGLNRGRNGGIDTLTAAIPRTAGRRLTTSGTTSTRRAGCKPAGFGPTSIGIISIPGREQCEWVGSVSREPGITSTPTRAALWQQA